MSNHLTIRYDRLSDTLYIDACEPYESQDSRSIAEDVIARFNPETGDVENLEIMFFSKRADSDPALRLPVGASLQLTQAS